MELRPIDDESLEDAQAVLRRGFPRKPRQFWAKGFERLKMTPGGRRAPYGYLLHDKGRDVGVILTFASEREAADGQRQSVVNLSSWYIEESSRWFAPMMLKSIVTRNGAVFTDLSSTPSVARINAALGFQPWNQGLLALFLPLTGVKARSPGRVRPIGQTPSDALSEPVRQMLDDHARMGCLVGVLEGDDAWHPLIFVRGRRYGIPLARLVYAQDRRAVLDSLGAVARHLLGQGQLLLLLDGNEDEPIPGKLFHRPRLTQFKGRMDPGAIDYAYSELAYLDLLT